MIEYIYNQKPIYISINGEKQDASIVYHNSCSASEWNTVSSIHPSHNILFVSLRGHLNTFIDFIIFI